MHKSPIFWPLRVYLMGTIFVHEVGHLAAALLLGYEVISFRVGSPDSETPALRFKLAGIDFRFWNNCGGGEVRFLYPENSRFLPLVSGAGPGAEIIFFAICSALSLPFWRAELEALSACPASFLHWMLIAGCFLFSWLSVTAVVLGLTNVHSEKFYEIPAE